MNCQRFEQLVSELARGQMMEADMRSEALAHSDDCEHCLALLRDEEKLTRGLQRLAAEMETLEAPAEMELKLREAFRTRHVAAPVAVNSSRSRYWLVAVAAMLLVALSVAAMWWRSEAPPQTVAGKAAPKPVETPIVPADPNGPQESVGPTQPGSQDVQYRAGNETLKRQTRKVSRRNSVTRKPEAQLANHATNEIATDFMPLSGGDMNTVVLQDGGQIIRVRLRRSELLRFGFPVNMERYNENVKADVLVGVDGLARAIRFVQ
ncbi:MAG TPA: hypothetical protein VM941_12175 [Pyrinomonadaceae bacterium]|nr:hypothetical protein [Pyrinomonadaceae bacterium]